MFGLGPSELMIILLVLVFLYGGKRLPQIGEGLGRSISEFKKAIRGPAPSTGKSGAEHSRSAQLPKAED